MVAAAPLYDDIRRFGGGDNVGLDLEIVVKLPVLRLSCFDVVRVELEAVVCLGEVAVLSDDGAVGITGRCTGVFVTLEALRDVTELVARG